MMMLVRSEWERLWAKKVTWLCFLMIPVMLLGAAKYYLKHNQEVERIAVDYTYANSFPILALSEMLMSICNLVLLVLIVLVFAQEYHSGQIRMVIQRSYTYSEVLIAKIITILTVSLLFIGTYFICSYCIGYIFFEHEPNILLFYHIEKMNALGVFLYCISYYGIAYLTLIAMVSMLIMLSVISKSTTSATLLGMGFIIFSFGYPAMALLIRKSQAFLLEYNAKNEIGELVGSFENMRAALATSLSRQWELEEERREYIRAISHDLKTPLTIVQGHTEGLQSGLWKNEDLLHRYLQTIERNTNRMTKLLEEFQTVNELESFAFQLRLNKVHINPFFLKKLEEYECIARKKEIEWDVTFENNEDVQSLVFDQERISQVMDNIVMNAVRFTPVSGEIFVKVCAWHETIEFHVYDSGPGFQEGDLKKVLQRFYQGDQSRSGSKEHFGLGLYIAKTIVEKHGGKIQVENSEVRGGAHVSFRIPSRGM